ncbi:hypothetical protein GF373_09515 [bacterium]|nr:hypothetical protein [bacterium]
MSWSIINYEITKRITSIIYTIGFVCFFMVSFSATKICADSDSDRIRPYEKNNAFWQYKGKPVMLIGGNQDDNTFQIPDLESYLDEIVSVGANYVRNVMSSRDQGNVREFKKLPNGKYDLDQWNDAYWRRLENLLKWSAERDIIVQLTLWDRFDYYRDEWKSSPWNPKNNINYNSAESGLAKSYPEHPAKDTNPFMYVGNKVMPLQEQWIDKILSYTFPAKNVLYNMANEHQSGDKGREWCEYWAGYVRDKASKDGVAIETTQLYDHQNWESVVNQPELYTFVEGAKVATQWTPKGEGQYDTAVTLIKATNQVKQRPVNGVKMRGSQHYIHYMSERGWRPLLAGFAALSWHREGQWGGLGFNATAQGNIKAMKKFTDIVIPWESEPRQDLLTDRENDEAYIRAIPGRAYGIYFVNGGSVGLNLKDQEGVFQLRWMKVNQGEWEKEVTIQGGKIVTINPPGKGGWAAVVFKP